MAGAARIGDMIACPAQTPTPGGPVPHVGGPIAPGGPPAKVMIGGQPAAVVGDMCQCTSPAGPLPGPIAKGSATVLIGGKPAARQGDQAGHGGAITAGCPTVMIGG
jgi:uncharacterized Zn-binding protein involved in type VI secretion